MTTWSASPISQQETFWIPFSTYDSITAVDLEINFENIRRAWDPQQPVESLFKQIQDCADYSKAGGVLIGHPQKINIGYANIFETGHFMSACRQWNEKHLIEKTWTQFKSHFAAARRQHKQMQGESAATAGYHSANAAVGQTEDQLAEATIGALANLAMATAADRGVVATLTEANARLVKQLEDNSNELLELKALIRKDNLARFNGTHHQQTFETHVDHGDGAHESETPEHKVYFESTDSGCPNH
jgi:hypothetical protein